MNPAGTNGQSVPKGSSGETPGKPGLTGHKAQGGDMSKNSKITAPVARDTFPTVDEVLGNPEHPMYDTFVAALAQARAEGAASVKKAPGPVRTAGAALAKAVGAFREDHGAAWDLVRAYSEKVVTGGAKRRPEEYRAACHVLFGSADADPTQTALWRVIAKREGG